MIQSFLCPLGCMLDCPAVSKNHKESLSHLSGAAMFFASYLKYKQASHIAL